MNENDVANLLLQDLQFEVGERVVIRDNPIGQAAGVWYEGGETGVIRNTSIRHPCVKFDLPNPKLKRFVNHNGEHYCHVDIRDLRRHWE